VRICNRLLLLFFCVLFFFNFASAQVRIAQLTDLHIGLARAPHAADTLREAVKIINDRGVDAVVVTGDVGENPGDWEIAREILGHLKAPVYYIPGNHDIHSNDFDRYRKVFGDDFYRVRVKNVVIYALDSEVFGNYDSYDAAKVALPPPSEEARENGTRMMHWLQESVEHPVPEERGDRDKARKHAKGNDRERDDHVVVIGMQHIPPVRHGNFPPDPRPYWTVPEPYRSQEIALLKKLGIHDMLVGHWHHRDEFEHAGIEWHVGAPTSWLTWGGQLGFDIHTITPDGKLTSEFIPLGR
jgi:DNA repair exonuclease SbcCD nuclease subunit